ncbi:MAG: hypothetical protein KC621_09125, partial [Myxococcales bacterium]|nr:hypothetical protein [Myxococcales bacterium]
LEALGDDPRVLAWLLAAFESPMFSAETTRPFWRVALARTEALADGGTAGAAEALAPGMVSRIPTAVGEWLGNQLAKLAKRLAARTFPDPEGLEALETGLRAVIADAVVDDAPAVSEEALVEAVWADPTSDGPRLVLQDFLLERADPWGELIALGFSDADPDRQTQLTRELRSRILGPLAAAADQFVVRRGFPDDVTLWRNKASVPKTVGLPAWSTVRVLRVPSWPDESYAPDRRIARALREIVAHDVMVCLEEVHGIADVALDVVLQGGERRWRSLTVRVGRELPTGWVERLHHLPHLRDLGIRLWGGDGAIRDALAAAGLRLDVLRVVSALPPADWMELADAAGVRRLEHTALGYKGARTVMTRDRGVLA